MQSVRDACTSGYEAMAALTLFLSLLLPPPCPSAVEAALLCAPIVARRRNPTCERATCTCMHNTCVQERNIIFKHIKTHTSSVFSWAVPADRQQYTSFYWQFNGLQSQAYTTGGLGYSQEVAITQPTILDDGYLDGDVVLDSNNCRR